MQVPAFMSRHVPCRDDAARIPESQARRLNPLKYGSHDAGTIPRRGTSDPTQGDGPASAPAS